MSLVIDIADAVTAELADSTFSQALTPQRKLLPEFDLADLKDLRVTVVPKTLEVGGATRATQQYEVAVDIGIQKKLGADLETEVAALLGLVDEIAAYLTRRPLAAMPAAAWVGLANDPIYAPEHLANQRVFTSVLTLMYRTMA
jgi:hypothetical protein